MTTHSTAVDHPSLRLVVRLVPEVDFARFSELTSWQATLELAGINAPHGFMRYAVDQPRLVSDSYDKPEIAAAGSEAV